MHGWVQVIDMDPADNPLQQQFHSHGCPSSVWLNVGSPYESVEFEHTGYIARELAFAAGVPQRRVEPMGDLLSQTGALPQQMEEV